MNIIFSIWCLTGLCNFQDSWTLITSHPSLILLPIYTFFTCAKDKPWRCSNGNHAISFSPIATCMNLFLFNFIPAGNILIMENHCRNHICLKRFLGYVSSCFKRYQKLYSHLKFAVAWKLVFQSKMKPFLGLVSLTRK